MIILFQNILFLKALLAWNGCFGLFSKIKIGSGSSIWFPFSAWFIHKNVPYLILSRYQTKCVIKLLFRQLMRLQTLRFLLDQPLKQWLTGKKRGESQNTKIWVSQEPKELFRWNKNIVFEGLSLDKKIKVWYKIADTSFDEWYITI